MWRRAGRPAAGIGIFGAPTRVQWSLGASGHAGHVIRALRKAFRARAKKELSGLVHHSDNGPVYASLEYRALVESRGIRMSRSRPWGHAEARVAGKPGKMGRQRECAKMGTGHGSSLELEHRLRQALHYIGHDAVMDLLGPEAQYDGIAQRAAPLQSPGEAAFRPEPLHGHLDHRVLESV